MTFLYISSWINPVLNICHSWSFSSQISDQPEIQKKPFFQEYAHLISKWILQNMLRSHCNISSIFLNQQYWIFTIQTKNIKLPLPVWTGMDEWQKKNLLLFRSHYSDARVCLSLCGAEGEQLSCVVQYWRIQMEPWGISGQCVMEKTVKCHFGECSLDLPATV